MIYVVVTGWLVPLVLVGWDYWFRGAAAPGVRGEESA